MAEEWSSRTCRLALLNNGEGGGGKATIICWPFGMCPGVQKFLTNILAKI